MKTRTLLLLGALLFGAAAQAQNTVTATLTDASNGDPVGFATVSLTLKGAKKPSKYILSSDSGAVKVEGVRAGSYQFKAELLGYEAFLKDIEVKGALDLGVVKMQPDRQQLEAASVTALGNPVIIKKDTVEYNATSFKTTDNDVLEDLLKKLPGVEVAEDGTITANGETIKKITIDGKTFFLDDPQLASKNIPAKIINKLKVIQKKSEQAEFTGIDDGEEETVIDLNIKPGMMRGAFGNVMAGAGHDIPSQEGIKGDTRYQGAAFMGKFTKKQQLSLILNGNNTNNRGFDDLSGSMMGNMRGGGGGMGRGQGGWGSGNGITVSYMAGVNGAWTLFDDKMDLSSNYLYNSTDKSVMEESVKTTYLDDSNLIYNTSGSNNTASDGHRIGVRIDHKFSKNTSILFEPRINFGTGHYSEISQYTTLTDNLNGAPADSTNRGDSYNDGQNRNVTTSGFALFRQRLGIPGRTLTVMARYSFSRNDLDGLNQSNTYTGYVSPGNWGTEDKIKQTVDQQRRSSTLWGRITYTEPLGNHFYVEANYAYNWTKSTSEKETWDCIANAKDYAYSNQVVNESNNQNLGGNLLYQTEKFRGQVGLGVMPTRTFNSTTKWFAGTWEPRNYEDFRWRFQPRAMFWWEMNDNANARLFYRGSSQQPAVNKLMPVPDNTDPLNISFGNPSLAPYFSHNLNAEYRYSNKRKFSSLNVRLNSQFVQDPIVNATWYSNGGAYSMPFNGPASGNASVNAFGTFPFFSSKFLLTTVTRASWSKSSAYVGKNINMGLYPDPSVDYYSFMEQFLADCSNETFFDNHFTTNTTETVTLMQRLRMTYRSNNLELSGSGRTRVNRSWYTISKDASNTTTWNNQIRFSANWTWSATGITVKTEGNYNWYRGYATAQPDEWVVNAEIQKLLLKNKFTLALKGYDIMGQSKNLTVSDDSNYHKETLNNTLGRYIILSLTWRFGTFDRSKMRRGPGMGGPGMGGGRGMGGGMGGGRRM
ncbi:MAG: TonB-dependent receptor [Bacteroidales bacterium]|nr:TonB-dependent receptor [Bacteroidales bacterium]